MPEELSGFTEVTFICVIITFIVLACFGAWELKNYCEEQEEREIELKRTVTSQIAQRAVTEAGFFENGGI